MIYDMPIFKDRKLIKKSNLKAKLDKEFSLYIRLRDSKDYEHKAFKCISCGRILPFEQSDCGHYINRQHMNTRYNEKNCNSQCRHCNRFMEGNIQEYRNRLIHKYGENEIKKLEISQHIIRKYTDYEYEFLISFYKKLNKEMKNGNY